MEIRIGKYVCSAGHVARKTYGDSRGITIAFACAKNAGIIGYEDNGIVLFDDDHGEIILDNHLRSGSGWGGPNADQAAEFERICSMKWKELVAFIADHPKTRGLTADDISEQHSKPAAGDLLRQKACGRDVDLNQGPSILSPALEAANSDESVAYSFPDRTRAAIIGYLSTHDVHRDGPYDSFRFSWGIKAHGFDASGKDYELRSPSLDRLWEALVEKDGQGIFEAACGDGLSTYLEGSFSAWPRDEDGDFRFAVQGRSGGHLVMTHWRGRSLSFDTVSDIIDWASELDDADLVDFYAGMKTLDVDVDPRRELAFQYGFQRELKEDEWSSNHETLAEDAFRLLDEAHEIAEALSTHDLPDEAIAIAASEASISDEFLDDVMSDLADLRLARQNAIESENTVSTLSVGP